uniref:Transmembrane protein n=1 Tax=Medicago truncatula TaxID=3880 RepID=I3S4E2_MEDTR|nr:unknown [Medicago truncatula]
MTITQMKMSLLLLERLCCRLLVIGRVLTGLVTSLLRLMKH